MLICPAHGIYATLGLEDHQAETKGRLSLMSYQRMAQDVVVSAHVVVPVLV